MSMKSLRIFVKLAIFPTGWKTRGCLSFGSSAVFAADFYCNVIEKKRGWQSSKEIDFFKIVVVNRKKFKIKHFGLRN